jgi:MoaA/NifB/PqqE/SkfB family radical SAM enzyme
MELRKGVNEMKSMKEFGSQVAVQQAVKYLNADPEKNLPKILKLAEKFATNPRDIRVIQSIQDRIKDPEDPWTLAINTFFATVNPNMQKKFAVNFFLNSVIYGIPKKNELQKELGIRIPWTILMDPTAKCNLKCTGCWAAEYDQHDDMTLETLDRIINEGKELGIYVYLYSGGEPTVRKDDLLELARRHDDCFFLAFSNGTLIDEDFADQIAEVGNLTFAFSVEGDEAATDFRRGEGTYQGVTRAMRLLQERGVFFGTSVCYHHFNYKEIGAEKFTDDMLDLGAFFMWLFTYMPIGVDANMDLVARADERAYMYDRVRDMRKRKPMFFMDFWNDGEYVDGCIAGGRNYFHINAAGDVEPCAFVHYSDTNIKDVSLKEALASPLFKAYAARQPFNCNHLRPCPILDNPENIRDMVAESGAHSTQPGDHESAVFLCNKCTPVAEKWAPVADRIWVNSPAGKKAMGIVDMESTKAETKTDRKDKKYV